MPRYSQTTTIQPSGQEQFLNTMQALQGLGSVAGQLGNIGINYARIKQQQEEIAAQRQMNKISVGLDIYNQAIKSNNQDLLKKSMTDYLEIPEQSANKYIYDRALSISIGNTKKSLAFENIGNLVNLQYRSPDGKLLDLSPEQAAVLAPITYNSAGINPEHWGKTYKFINGSKAPAYIQQAIGLIDQTTSQEIVNLKTASDNNPSLDVDDQIASIGIRSAIEKAKLMAGIEGVKISDEFGGKYISELDKQDALRIQAQGQPLSPYQDRLINEAKRIQEKHEAQMKGIEASTILKEKKFQEVGKIKPAKELTPEEKAKKQADLFLSITKATESASYIKEDNIKQEVFSALEELKRRYKEIYSPPIEKPTEKQETISDEIQKILNRYDEADDKLKAKMKAHPKWGEIFKKYR